ncbi:MAG TPA: hypothetical protein VHZ03_31855 [Trebonia sp.]|nr:hypothetical protein [Trebonia sp.]
MWDIRAAITTGIAAAISGLAILTLVAWLLLRKPGLPHAKSISLHDSISVLQLVFASVAGAGALVGLIVAYRRQKVAEADSAHDRTRVYNERFATISAQLGDDKPAIRLAGAHAMAGLADDWKDSRQTCIDVLCAYLRIPYEADPGRDAAAVIRMAYEANREVRHTIIRLIAAHLRDNARTSWQGLDLDFTGVNFDGGDFSKAIFSGGSASFREANFSSGLVFFGDTQFSGGVVTFVRASFSGGGVSFARAIFSGGEVMFGGAEFSSGIITFREAAFSGGTVTFNGSLFSGGTVEFPESKFSDGVVGFDWAEFRGGRVEFYNAHFNGGRVDFSGAQDWSSPPFVQKPTPIGVRLPSVRRNQID